MAFTFKLSWKEMYFGREKKSMIVFSLVMVRCIWPSAPQYANTRKESRGGVNSVMRRWPAPQPKCIDSKPLVKASVDQLEPVVDTSDLSLSLSLSLSRHSHHRILFFTAHRVNFADEATHFHFKLSFNGVYGRDQFTLSGKPFIWISIHYWVVHYWEQ